MTVPNEKESTFLTYNDGARLFLVRLVTGTLGHSANALDGIQTRAMGWTVGGGVFFFFLNGWFQESRRRSRSANGQRQPDALDGILESEPTSRL